MKRLRQIAKKQGRIIIPEPIHYRTVDYKTFVKEDFDEFLTRPHNKDLFDKIGVDPTQEKDPYKLVSQYMTSRQRPLSSDEKKALHIFDLNNKSINKKLMTDGKLDGMGEHAQAHNILRNVVNRRFGNSLTVFSGLDFDPQEHGRPGNVFHSPSYISATHNPYIAASYATTVPSKKGDHSRHIAQINIEPDDKAFFAGKYSKFSDEHHTLMPPGTSLRYHEAEKFDDNGPLKVHHFTINSQRK